MASATYAGRVSVALTTGLFTLLGVIVGGCLNYAVTTAIEERRGRRALRTTARIVGEELGTNGAIVTATIEFGRWTPMGNAPLHFDAWHDYRHVLAERLPDENWDQLRDAMRQLRMMDRVHKLGEPARPFSAADMPHLREARDAAQSAMAMLDRYSRIAARTGP